MREKIRIILAECWNKVGGQVETTTKLEALFTAETAAMREALTLSRKHIGHLLQNPDKYKKTGETHEVLAKIDTALKGGK